MNLLIRLIISTIAVLVTDLLLSGVSIGDMGTTNGFLTALLVAAVLGLLNTIVKPLLVILTLPITFLTLGLFLLVINAGLVLLADKLIGGFTVDSFWWALGFSLVLSMVQGSLNALDGGSKRKNSQQ
ncbi:MAG TPA: phage holin family protein [Flavobacteriales bacterium]|nr:phage holin family protein [Flavobacteriales bacterium]